MILNIPWQKELRIFVWRVNWFDRYGRHIFSPNEDDLSYSTRTIFPDNIKMVKARQTTSWAGRTYCLSAPFIAA